MQRVLRLAGSVTSDLICDASQIFNELRIGYGNTANARQLKWTGIHFALKANDELSGRPRCPGRGQTRPPTLRGRASGLLDLMTSPGLCAHR